MKTRGLHDKSLDEALDELKSSVESLSRPKTAAFFVSCASVLLPLYDEFFNKNKWGDPELIRSAIEAASLYATGKGVPPNLGSLLRSVRDVAPDGERFDAPESTFAQDVAISVDAALRAADPQTKLEPAWAEYVVEPAMVTACLQQTGYMDLGSSDEEEAWRRNALSDIGLRRAFEASFRMIDFLSPKAELSLPDLAELRSISMELLPVRKSGE